MAKAASRAEAAKRQLEQRDAKLEEVAEEMKRKEVVEINRMNNLRNSLLAKEQASKQMESSLAALSSKQVALEASQAKLESRLEQRRQLIVKLKGVALYKEPEDITQNKEVSNSLKIATKLLIFFIRSGKTLATNISLIRSDKRGRRFLLCPSPICGQLLFHQGETNKQTNKQRLIFTCGYFAFDNCSLSSKPF